METAVFKFKVDLASVKSDTYTWKLSTTVAIDVQNNIKLLLGGTGGVKFTKSKFNENGGDTAEKSFKEKDNPNVLRITKKFELSQCVWGEVIRTNE